MSYFTGVQFQRCSIHLPLKWVWKSIIQDCIYVSQGPMNWSICSFKCDFASQMFLSLLYRVERFRRYPKLETRLKMNILPYLKLIGCRWSYINEVKLKWWFMDNVFGIEWWQQQLIFLPYLNIYTYSNKYLFWFIQNKKQCITNFYCQGISSSISFQCPTGAMKEAKTVVVF